jgi:hypothetical protein
VHHFVILEIISTKILNENIVLFIMLHVQMHS